MHLEAIFNKFVNSRILSSAPLGDGHINDTFLIRAENGKYVMQRVKSTMNIEACLYNYGLYSPLCDDSGWRYPVWMKNSDGKYFYTDETGSYWRLYSFISGDILSAPVEKNILYSCGQGLARMHTIFSRFPETPKSVYPHLHDLSFYYDTYLKVLQSPDMCKENRDSSIEEKIEVGIDKMLNVRQGRVSVIHGDAKLANILFGDGKVIGFIDFDTVMPGYLLEDVADCIRSCCIENGKLNKDKAGELVRGYTDTAPKDMTADMERLPEVFDKICFELGLRYYTDALANEKVFKEKYPGFRLDRARSLFN